MSCCPEINNSCTWTSSGPNLLGQQGSCSTVYCVGDATCQSGIYNCVNLALCVHLYKAVNGAWEDTEALFNRNSPNESCNYTWSFGYCITTNGMLWNFNDGNIYKFTAGLYAPGCTSQTPIGNLCSVCYTVASGVIPCPF